MLLYNKEKLTSDKFFNLKEKGEELLYEAPNKKAVTALQSFLNEEGYTDQNGEKLRVNGRYDASTANAVLRYQNANGLKGDGITGDKTWKSIYNKKRKKEEDASFFEELKGRSNGYFNDKLKVFRQAQRILGIEPEGVLGGKEEKVTFTQTPFDVWKGGDASSTDISSTDAESLRDRKRKRLENSGRVALPEIKDYIEDGSPKNLPSVPEPFGYAVESSEKTDYLITDNTPDYQIFKGNGNMPKLTLMSNAGSEESTSSESKAEEDKGEELGIIKSGYNAKGEWSENPDADNYGKDSDTYKILSDLNSRWESATVKEKAEYYSMAKDIRRLEKEGTPIKYAQDEIMNLLHENARIAKEYQENLTKGASGMMFQIEGGSYFLNSVAFLIGAAYGMWNYKYNDYWRVPYDTFDGNDMSKDNNKNWRPWMYFDGMLISADKLGNMNMAYVGMKMGLPKIVFQNDLTTDKDDAFWVQYGIDLAEQGR